MTATDGEYQINVNEHSTPPWGS